MIFNVCVKKYDQENLYIELPEEIIDDIGFAPGDSVEWIVQDDGSLLLKKVLIK